MTPEARPSSENKIAIEIKLTVRCLNGILNEIYTEGLQEELLDAGNGSARSYIKEIAESYVNNGIALEDVVITSDAGEYTLRLQVGGPRKQE
jgi:hypothetical protein